YDINYKSKDDFSAKMAMVGMDEIDLNSKVDEASAYYFYGDTKGRMLYMIGSWGQKLSSGIVAYKGAESAPVYLVEESEVINNCFAGVRYDYTSIDLELVRSLKEKAEKSFSWDQYQETAKKLANEFGFNLQ
ncbi:MAG: hypothetical protein K2N32_04770, partial [Clostridia bacterium]|nr:hypothetical protein [Clostridia bacterium]